MNKGVCGTITVPQQIHQDETDFDGKPIKTGIKSTVYFSVVKTNRGRGIIGSFLTDLRGLSRGR